MTHTHTHRHTHTESLSLSPLLYFSISSSHSHKRYSNTFRIETIALYLPTWSDNITCQTLCHLSLTATLDSWWSFQKHMLTATLWPLRMLFPQASLASIDLTVHNYMTLLKEALRASHRPGQVLSILCYKNTYSLRAVICLSLETNLCDYM